MLSHACETDAVGDAAVDEEQDEKSELNITKLDVLCVGGIIADIVHSWVSLAFVPKLIGTNPVLLELIRGSTSSMVTAGAFARDDRANAIVAVLAGTVGLGFFNVFYWWAGRRYGNRVLQYYTQGKPRLERRVQRSERFLARWGGPTLIVQYFLLPIPKALIWVGTGTSGVKLWKFLVYNALGCMLWVVGAVSLGYAIGHPAVHAAERVSHYATRVTIGLVIVIFVYAFFRGWQEMKRAEAAEAAKEAAEEESADVSTPAAGK
jgi:membrane protein DedA with SNARE-associated domain